MWHVVSSFKFSIQKNTPAPQAYSGVVATRSGSSQKVFASPVKASDAARKLLQNKNQVVMRESGSK